jgi:hypothetical protein
MPDNIILWIYKDDFDKLPKHILDMQNNVFFVKQCNDDLRSFKKIVPALQYYSDEFIVTADDDLYYNYDWLEELVGYYSPNQKEIIGHRGHKITFDASGSVRPYNNWKWCVGGLVSGHDIFLTGCAGILYPPGSLISETVKSEIFMELCPTADDVWLYFMTRLNGYIPKKIPSDFREFSWPSSQEVTLNSENVIRGSNDICISNLERKYGTMKYLVAAG